MRAGAAALLVLLAAAPGAAQDDAGVPRETTPGEPSDGEVAPSEGEVAPSEGEVAPSEPGGPTEASSSDEGSAAPEGAGEPAARTEPSAPVTPRSAPSAGSAPATQPAVIIRHHDERDEDDEDEEEPQDGGDPYDILWIELFGGASYVDLRAIDTTNYYPEFVRLAGWGPAGGAALGFRVEFFSFGVRAAFAHYDASDADHPDAIFDVGTATAEVKLALPLPIVQPFVRVGFGFAWHGDSNVEDAWATRSPPSNIQTTVFGWVFQGGVGLDIYLAEWFAVGAAFSIDVLNMNRHSFDEEPTEPTGVMFRENGDAVGVQARGQGAVSFHF